MKPILLILSPALLLPSVLLSAEFHVSPSGSDSNPGTGSKPFATIERAQQAVVAEREKNPAQPVTVWLAPGLHLQRDGISFGSAESGTAANPVTYRSSEGGVARISAGFRVPPAAVKKVEDAALLERLRPEARGQVVAIDVKALGLTPASFSNVFRKIEFLEVFFKGNRLPLSRWPNGQVYSTMKEVVESGLKPPGPGTFIYREDDPARWLTALEDGGVWLRGFWRVPWHIEVVRVAKIDPVTRTITFAAPVGNGIGSKYARDKNGIGNGDGKEPWHALNLLEEIDQPGEWSLNFATGILYLWPPAPITEGSLLLADRNVPLVSFSDASHIVLRGLTLECSLGHAVSIKGGEGIRILGCTIRQAGDHGVWIDGGKNHEVRSCDISGTGQSGIRLTGGDRATLTPGKHQITNNLVTGIGVYFPAPGIVVGEGTKSPTVGNHVSQNRIHDVPSAGIVFAGNNNLMELNDIYRCGLGAGDLGAFYTNSGWTARGNIIRHNFVHHSMNANAFYLDDGSCGSIVEENIVYKAASGGFIGGGHDHLLKNNIFAECSIGIHIDDRGISRKYVATDKRLRGDLDSVPYQSPPWSEQYPALVGILDGRPDAPSGLKIESNLLVANVRHTRYFSNIAESPGFSNVDNVESADATLLPGAQELDFSIPEAAQLPASLAPLRAIPLAKIGLQQDEFRKVVPPRDMKLLREGKTERRFDSLQDIEATNQQQQP
ncbi:MAG: right-handed parallel beta-helix repeat-containing protein [Candidatus Methylacidiphilales bacterium]|nr:right-handed parallel beta-helix repeat-containing protein [Candidatus Methylacidiphilales bacterium]